MSLSSAQCRAGRALLDWSQEELAANAQIARATIADFERGTRTPTRSNLAAIKSALFAGGVDLISEPDEGVAGAGVRFRKCELEYSRSLKSSGDDLIMSVRYRGNAHRIIIPRDILDDLGGRFGPSPNPDADQRMQIVQDRMVLMLTAIERWLSSKTAAEETLVLLHEAFPDGTF